MIYKSMNLQLQIQKDQHFALLYVRFRVVSCITCVKF